MLVRWRRFLVKWVGQIIRTGIRTGLSTFNINSWGHLGHDPKSKANGFLPNLENIRVLHELQKLFWFESRLEMNGL